MIALVSPVKDLEIYPEAKGGMYKDLSRGLQYCDLLLGGSLWLQWGPLGWKLEDRLEGRCSYPGERGGGLN